MAELTAATVGTWLWRQGLVADPGAVSAEPLGGGVSSAVLGCRAPGLDVVVKQALPRFRVADEWLVSPRRAVVEARALRAAAEVAPEAVPRVLALDEETCTLAIERAPAGWAAWKRRLLAGEADPSVAARLGSLLGAWHRGLDPALAGEDGARGFDEQRLDPYYRTTASRNPDLADVVLAYADRLTARRDTLVHGDFSPKNVLVSPAGAAWVIDWEIAHAGDPAFDLAFLLNHLLLKSVVLPRRAPAFLECAEAFHAAYASGVPQAARPRVQEVTGQLGCLALARVDGKSPAEYLVADDERETVRRVAAALLAEPPDELAGVWALVDPARSAASYGPGP